MEELFPDFENTWQREWHDMPEFTAEDNKPVKQLIVSFKEWADYKYFASLIDTKLSKDTISIWYPAFDRVRPSDYCYVDERD